MKKFLLSGASALAIASALPALAQAADLPIKAAPAYVPEATGYIEVYGGWASTRYDTGGGNSEEGISGTVETFKGGLLGGAGRGNYWVSPTVSIQLDVQAEGTSYDIPNSSVSNASALDYLIGGHVSWRDPGRGLWGAFAGIGDVGSFGTGTRHAVFGAEGQYYYGHMATLYVQGGYDTTLHRTSTDCAVNLACSEGAVDVNAWFVRGTGRYYVTPNLRLEATAMYANGEQNVSSGSSDSSWSQTFDMYLWEAKAEWKMDHSPFAFFFKYRGSETDYKNYRTYNSGTEWQRLDSKVTDNRFMVGARIYLGEKTLLWNDRNGATLDIISPLAVQSGPLYSATGSGTCTFIQC